MPWVESDGKLVWLDGFKCSWKTPTGLQCLKPCTRIGAHERHTCKFHDIKGFGAMMDRLMGKSSYIGYPDR